MTDVVSLSKELIQRKSITPNDAGCQQLLGSELKAAGFTLTEINVDDTTNLLATHGQGAPFFVFAGHTDVVPPGPLDQWQTDPFLPTEKNGMLYGRGAADMKAALAAMTLSATQFVEQNPNHPGTIALAITSDEEGKATNGTIKIVEYLQQNNLIPDYVVVGEASSNEKAGDAIKIGRRGSIHGKIIIHGKQGHIAYPKKAINPIHTSLIALNQIAETQWDRGNKHYPPSSFQFYDIQAGVGATNVIPGELTAKFNIRYAPTIDATKVEQIITDILTTADLEFTLECKNECNPFYSGECELANAAKQAVEELCGIESEYNTHGGTSDGRHFAPLGSQVIELGVINKTIHKINECTNIEELKQIEKVYLHILNFLFKK